MLLNISRSFTSFRLVRQIFCLVWLVLIFAVFDFSACAQEPRVPGPRSDGSVILPNQWLLRPVGKQVEVGDFPINIAIHPEGSFAAVLHCGYGPHEIVILDLTRRAVVSRTRLEEAFYGLSFDASGKTLFASGSGAELIHRYRFENGTLIPSSPLPLRDAMQRGIPAGIATTSDGSVLFAANLWAQSVSRVNLKEDNPEKRIAELLLTGKPVPLSPVLSPSTDDPSITKRARQLLEASVADLPYPYACVLDEPRNRLYVSLWAQAAVAVIDTLEFKLLDHWSTEEHPNEMLLSPDGKRLFVANANRNSVSVIDPGSGKIIETLVATLTPDAPPGNTPNSLALSPSGEYLFVANANINTIAVFDVEHMGASKSLGFIPVGWYPTSVRLTPDGKRLLVANGKGLISDSNRNGPRPGFHPEAPTPDYIGALFQGTVAFIDLPLDEMAFEKQMIAWTQRAMTCRPLGAESLELADIEGSPIPLRKVDKSPITHVIYMIKENRTYDQVLGDMPEGRGDPTLCLFPEHVTPNHHALAREFVLLDNFYVESEVSADGHEWTMGAYASDFVEKQWPLSYGHNRRNKHPYPSEGAYDLPARPAGGYLWDRAIEAGVSVRSYGEWVSNAADPSMPGTAKVKALEGRIDPMFRSFDMGYPDIKRADRFIAELERFNQEGDMPRLQIVRLPNDHTSGTSPRLPTPTSYMADNDLAFGRIVEAVSRSPFWPTTAIFVVEDDAQNGPDHIDAHRTIAFVISPYARRTSVDSTLYSTSSMLRTIELILGLDPMSQFDASAMPMLRSFQKTPTMQPYVCRSANVPLDTLNKVSAWGAEESLKMNLAVEDAADDLLLNEIVWRSVRGEKSSMPAPRRAAFVFIDEEDEDEE